MAEEGASEVRLSSATSFTNEHCQPRVPQGSHLNPPKFAQEPHPSSNTSLLRFSEQASDKSPQPQEMEKLDNPVEEEGRRAEGGMWRGSEHGTHNSASICEHSGVVLLSRYTLYVCKVLSNLTVSKTKCVVCVPKCLTKDHAHQML